MVFIDEHFGRQIQTPKSPESLFVPFSLHTTCPFETICPSKQFFRFLVWTRLITTQLQHECSKREMRANTYESRDLSHYSRHSIGHTKFVTEITYVL